MLIGFLLLPGLLEGGVRKGEIKNTIFKSQIIKPPDRPARVHNQTMLAYDVMRF